MYGKSIRYYDRIYASKDYGAEVERLVALIDARLASGRRRLLDVACGTARHLDLLTPRFDAEGLDRSPGFLEVARERCPSLRFHEGDMCDFDLGVTFDVVTCLFSSIGYLTRVEDVRRAADTFHRHLAPGGLVMIEPWFTPDQWNAGTVHATFIDDPELKIARVNTSYGDGRLPWFDLHHVIGTPEKTEHFVERHEMGLYETRELVEVFTAAGFEVEFDVEGLAGRGLLIGIRSAG